MTTPSKLPLAQRVLSTLRSPRAHVSFAAPNTTTSASAELPVQVFGRNNPHTFVSTGVFGADIVVPEMIAPITARYLDRRSQVTAFSAEYKTNPLYSVNAPAKKQ